MPRVLERRASQRQRERRSLLLREAALKTGIVGIDEFAQSLHTFDWGTKGSEGRSGVDIVEDQREIVDPGTLFHEVQVQHCHQGTVLELHIVVPEVPMDQLPRQFQASLIPSAQQS